MSDTEHGVKYERLAAASESPAHATPSSVALRIAVPADAHGIALTHVASWRNAYASLLPRSLLDGLSVDRRASQWDHDIATGRYAVHVAVHDDGLRDVALSSGTQVAQRDSGGQILGFVATSASRDKDAAPNVGELVAIYVHPDALRRGVGTQLHRTALATLATQFDTATLWVLDGNERACAFYTRHGWQSDSVKKTATLNDGTEIVEERYRRSLRD